MQKLAIVTPVLNDWASLGRLVETISAQAGLELWDIEMVAVDDGSTTVEPPTRDALRGQLSALHVLELNANQGHQRAIGLGLAYVHRELSPDAILIMDSDGEDLPEFVPALIRAHAENPDTIIVASRTKRTESLAFQLFYRLYKFIFRAMTGASLSFGNFSLIPAKRLPNVLFHPGIWNNFAATLLKCRIPIVFVPVPRGTRYFGSSTMNFASLMIHGFSAISLFSDFVIVRVILALTIMSILTVLGIIAVLLIKIFGSTFVPGYATTVILFMTTGLSLALLTGFLLILSLLATRATAATTPTALFEMLVRRVTLTRRDTPTPHG